MGRRRKSPIAVFITLLLVIAAILYSQGHLPFDSILDKTTWEKPSACGDLTVHVLNVSQADAIFIITPGNKTILIDSGSAMKKGSATKLVAFLDHQGIIRIDYVVATHFHEDHIGGMKYVLPTREIGTVFTNGNCANSTSKTTEEFLNLSKAENFKTVYADSDLPSDGCLDVAKLIVAYDRSKGCYKNENDNSILVRLEYGNTSFLFDGDCEKDCEKELKTQNTRLETNFLKVGHHGSSTSSSDGFLSAVNPTFAIISTDMNRSAKDRYFHPRLSTMEKLRDLGNNVYRTDLNGNTKAVSDGSKITIYPEAQADECQIFRGYGSSNASGYSLIPELTDVCGG